MFAQTELARAVLLTLRAGRAVPTHHATQLRNWAVCSAVLPLEEIAWHILGRTGIMADAPPVVDWRRVGAEFIVADLKLAFTFLEIARTSSVTETVRRNQKNARAAYKAVLRFLPQCLPALSVAELQAVEDSLRKLKNRLEELGGFSWSSN